MRRFFYPIAALAVVTTASTAYAQTAPNAPPAPGAPQAPATPAAPNAPATPAAPGTAPGTPGTTGGSTPGTAPGQNGVGQTAAGQQNTTTTRSQTIAPNTGGSIPREAPNPSPIYDVPRTIREAVQASTDYLLAQRNVQIDEKRADETRALNRPNVTGNGSATRFDQATKIAIGGGPPVQTVPSHQEVLSLVVSQRLDLLGTIRAETNQARLQTEADRAILDRITKRARFARPNLLL